MATVGAPGRLVDGAGRDVNLGARLGEGGEGSVYRLKDRPGVVAKIYRDARDGDDQRQKLKKLIGLESERLHRAAAWPVDSVYSEDGKLIGFLMEHLDGWMPLYSICQIRSRTRLMPGRDWSYLVRVSRNVATCVHYLHEVGIVVGDLNESNILVDKRAMAKLIDVDSVQVEDGDKLFGVDVGKSEMLPPELQGRSLAGKRRTQQHDLFALAVLLFQILVLGRHPFAGRPRQGDEPTLELCITNGWYAFTKRREVPISPPPMLNLDFLPPRLLEMFEDAFEPDATARPAAHDWFMELKQLEENLERCEEGSGHLYWSELSSCPWCDLESKWRVSIFSGRQASISADPVVAVEALWSDIKGVKPPAEITFPEIPQPQQEFALPEDDLRLAKLKRWMDGGSSLMFMPLWIALMSRGLNGGAGNFVSILFGLFVLVFTIHLVIAAYLHRTVERKHRELKNKVEADLSQYLQLRMRWHQLADPRLFHQKREELREVADRLANLHHAREHLRMKALRETYGEHLKSYLHKYSLAIADVANGGTHQLEELMRWGVRTAAEVDQDRLVKLKVDQALIKDLIAWRDSLELQYWQATPHDISPTKERMIEESINQSKEELLAKLKHGKYEMETLSRMVQENQISILKDLQDVVLRLEDHRPQFFAYAKALNAPTEIQVST
jgi:DNA-binding helix-hairpin-helix protein with protein kinase domain